MAYFKGLDDYLQPRNKIKVKGYDTESTVSSNFAADRLTDLAGALLKKAVIAANDLKSKGLVTQDVSGNMSIKERAKFFENNTPAKLAASQSKLNERVIFVRKWLSRQGAHFKGDYEIDHFKSSNKLVKYDTDLARQGSTFVKIVAGTFFYNVVPKGIRSSKVDTGKMVTHFSGPGKAIYVLSKQSNLHIGSHKVGQYHHSSLLAARPVACAGELEIKDGRLVYISNKSGHYMPAVDDFLHVLAVLQNKGVNMQFAVQVNDNGVNTKYDDVSEFLQSVSLDNASIERLKSEASEMIKYEGDNDIYYQGKGNSGAKYGAYS